MSALIPGLAMLVGSVITLLGYFVFDRWRSSTTALGTPTPLSARVVSEKLDKAAEEANVETDNAVEGIRKKSPTELLELAKAMREKGRGK